MTAILTINGITKSWGGNKVLNKVDIDMRVDALGLVGPNGAGKSTLLNIVAGIVKPDEGEIFFSGEKVTGLHTWNLVKMGLVKTNQIPHPFRTLTVKENVEVLSQRRKGKNKGTVEILQITGLEEFENFYPSALPFGYLKRLELARALACNPNTILLDEPLGGLSPHEAVSMVETLKKLKESGIKLVVVEHRLSELFTLVEEVVALDRGVKIFQGKPEKFSSDPAVASAYMG